jgi:hypothetical protein
MHINQHFAIISLNGDLISTTADDDETDVVILLSRFAEQLSNL